MNDRQIGNETKWAGQQSSSIINHLWVTRFDPVIPPTIPLNCALVRVLLISFVVCCCLMVPSKSAAKYLSGGSAPRGSSANQPISIAGQIIYEGDEVEVELPNGLDSTRLRVNDTVSAFLTGVSSQRAPAVILRVVHLNNRVSSGGFADVEVLMESIDHDGKRVATPKTVARVVTDERDLVKTEGNAAANLEVAAAREVDKIFGTGQKDAVRIPAGELLRFRIGRTESYALPQNRSTHSGRLRPWFSPKAGPQK